MKTYYHNTTADNKNNTILGYASPDGEFYSKSEFKSLIWSINKIDLDSDPSKGMELDYYLDIKKSLVKIIVESGLLSCEPYDVACRSIARQCVGNYEPIITNM